eukprot:PhF_6_TR7566/c0_g1_i1/m.11154
MNQQEKWGFVGHCNAKEWMIRQKWREKYQPNVAHHIEQMVSDVVTPEQKPCTHHRVHRHHKHCPKYALKLTQKEEPISASSLPQLQTPSSTLTPEGLLTNSLGSTQQPNRKLYPRQLLPPTQDYSVVPVMMGKAICRPLAGGVDPTYYTMTTSEEHRMYPNFLTNSTATGHALLQKNRQDLFPEER